MNTLSTITVLPSTKEEISIYVEGAKAEILNSTANDQLNIWRQLKAFAQVIKQLEDDPEIKNSVLECSHGHGKTFELKGAKFTLKTLPKWNYSGTGDKRLEELEKQIADLKKLLSARQKMLQNLTGPVKDGDNEIHPPMKIIDEVLSVTIL